MIKMGQQLLDKGGNFYVAKSCRATDTAVRGRGHEDAGSMPVRYVWPARPPAEPASPQGTMAPAPPPAAPSSLRATMATLFLGANILVFGANVLLQQRRERRPSRRQWGVAAVAAAVAACAWAMWWRRARARQRLER